MRDGTKVKNNDNEKKFYFVGMPGLSFNVIQVSYFIYVKTL